MLNFCNTLPWEGQLFVIFAVFSVFILVLSTILYILGEISSNILSEFKNKKNHELYGFDYKMSFKMDSIFTTRL